MSPAPNNDSLSGLASTRVSEHSPCGTLGRRTHSSSALCTTLASVAKRKGPGSVLRIPRPTTTHSAPSFLHNCKVTARSRSGRVFVFPVSDFNGGPKPRITLGMVRKGCAESRPRFDDGKVCISIRLIAYSKVTNSARSKSVHLGIQVQIQRTAATCRGLPRVRAPRQSCSRATVPRARRG